MVSLPAVSSAGNKMTAQKMFDQQQTGKDHGRGTRMTTLVGQKNENNLANPAFISSH